MSECLLLASRLVVLGGLPLHQQSHHTPTAQQRRAVCRQREALEASSRLNPSRTVLSEDLG